jgi:hypothetical protein
VRTAVLPSAVPQVSASTVNRKLAAVSTFYAYQARNGAEVGDLSWTRRRRSQPWLTRKLKIITKAVLDALAAPRGGGDPRTRKRRSTPTAPTSANRRPGRRARSRLAVVQPAAEKKIVTRMRTHYDAVQQLQAQGLSKAAISRKLGRHPATVRKFASARGSTPVHMTSVL